MAWRYPRDGQTPDVEHYDGHTIVVEEDGDELAWYVDHVPACGEPDDLWGHPCWADCQVSMVGVDAFGPPVKGQRPGGGDWPYGLPYRVGRWPVGCLVTVYSNWELGDEVDVFLVVASPEYDERFAGDPAGSDEGVPCDDGR